MAAPLIDLEHFLPYRISVLANLMSTAIAAAYDERFGLTIPEWRVIAVLTRYPGLSAREVADKSRMDAVAVSRAVNRLIRAGRLRRAIAAQDRRRSVLQVSEAGASVYREVAPFALEFERGLRESISAADAEQFDRMLGVLTARAESLSASLRRDLEPVRRRATPGRRRAPRRLPRR